jgi:hypothetical protein
MNKIFYIRIFFIELASCLQAFQLDLFPQPTYSFSVSWNF